MKQIGNQQKIWEIYHRKAKPFILKTNIRLLKLKTVPVQRTTSSSNQKQKKKSLEILDNFFEKSD